MTETKPIVSIENVVASASVDQAIDLADVTKKFPSTEWHPDQFPGLVFRLTSPKTATLIFRSGKMVCTGGKSEDMASKAVRSVVQQLRKGKLNFFEVEANLPNTNEIKIDLFEEEHRYMWINHH